MPMRNPTAAVCRPFWRASAPHFLPGAVRVVMQPLGAVGIVSPWNYPLSLCLTPLGHGARGKQPGDGQAFGVRAQNGQSDGHDAARKRHPALRLD